MKKILVIEDNNDIRENTAEILTLSGYDVITAVHGKEGVELALSQLPDLIVCDIMMPVLDGYGVLHLLSKHEETASVPFIFLTAKSEKSDMRKGMEMGADDYLTKPFSEIDLLNAIEIRLKKFEMANRKFHTDNDELTTFLNTAKHKGLLQIACSESITYQFRKKHLLYKEGQKPKAVYKLLAGKVKVFKINEDGKELITGMYTAGEFFGYLPVLQDTNYKDNAEVLEESEAIMIPREDFKKLITSDAQTAKEFIGLMTNNMMSKEEDLLNLAYNTLRKKVAYGLTRLIEKYKSGSALQTIINLPREDVAQSVGIATESLIRTLTDFKKEGLIDLQPGKVIILNEDKLRNLPF